ncbi:hypothetical protein pb186bvf_003844 [Paramecium bursaria]
MQITTNKFNRVSSVRRPLALTVGPKAFQLPNLKNQANRKVSQSFTESHLMSDYQLDNVIGTGQYAKVYSGRNKADGQRYAVKIYDKNQMNTMKKGNLQREIEILKTLDHPNIIKLHHVIETQKTYNLVMEYGGQICLKNQNLQEYEIKEVIKQILAAINYLTTKNIIHRDIKMENILYYQGQIKLIDFGFAIRSDGSKQNVFCGTPNYMAPEIVRKVVSYSYEVDIWACGVILFYLLTSQFPFKANSEKELYSKILTCSYNRKSIPCEGGQYLISKLLAPNPLKRIKADMAIKDTWLSPIDFTQALKQLQ